MTLRLLLGEQRPSRLGSVLYDTAVLEGLIVPTGTITFNLYGPDDNGCAGPPIFTSVVTVSGNGTYRSEGFRPTRPGTYRWIASYSGDTYNGPMEEGCNEPNQTVTVLAGDPRYGVHSRSRWRGDEVVPESWLNDVAGLGVGRVRLDIRYEHHPEAAACDATEAAIDGALAPILAAIEKYTHRAVEPLVILGGGILSIDGSFSPEGPGVCSAGGSTYIPAFAARAAFLASKLAPVGVRHFEIWNEPNVPLSPDGENPNPEFISDPTVFAGLVSTATAAIRASVPGCVIVTGGVFLSEDNEDSALGRAYLVAAMEHLTLMPGDRIGVHAYWSGPGHAGPGLERLYADLRDAQVAGTLWITEFGSPRTCRDPLCDDEASGVLHAESLREWYQDAIQPRLVGGPGSDPFIDAAFWFCHQWEEATNHGLTTWARNSGKINATRDHWPAWERLEGIVRLMRAP